MLTTGSLIGSFAWLQVRAFNGAGAHPFAVEAILAPEMAPLPLQYERVA